MSDTPTTDRQQYWLAHAPAADASEAFNEAEVAAATSDDPEVEQPDILGSVAVPAHRRAEGIPACQCRPRDRRGRLPVPNDSVDSARVS